MSARLFVRLCFCGLWLFQNLHTTHLVCSHHMPPRLSSARRESQIYCEKIMAGRSGAAAIEMELRAAAVDFCEAEALQRLSKSLRQTDPQLADGLLAINGVKPAIERREDELFLTFAAANAARVIQKTDVSHEFGAIPYGIEIHSHAGTVLGVSLYLQ